MLSRTDRRMRGIDRVLGGEKAIDVVTGHIDGKSIGSKDDKISGVLVLTPTRLMFYHQSLFGIGKYKTEEYALSRINSININAGMTGATIHIISSGNDLIMKCGITDQNPTEFVKNVKMQMSGSIPAQQVVTNEIHTTDIADQIKKLADLRDQGILTDDEFNMKKKQLLGI